MKQEIPELSLCLAHWFLRVWEFGASGSSLTRNVKPANPANCHGKVREVKKIILHCRIWLIFWHWENNFCQQKQNLQSMGWGTESQTDRVALAAVPGPIMCALCTLNAAARAAKFSHADPNCSSNLSKILFAEEVFEAKRWQGLSKPDTLQGQARHISVAVAQYGVIQFSVNLIFSLTAMWWASSLFEISQARCNCDSIIFLLTMTMSFFNPYFQHYLSVNLWLLLITNWYLAAASMTIRT